MVGGHGTAAAFGATIENLGISNASSVGIAAATFGLMLAGLLGGPVAKFLIEKNNLKSHKSVPKSFKNTSTKSLSITSNSSLKIDAFSFLEQVLIVLLCISCGEFIANMVYKSTRYNNSYYNWLYISFSIF